VPESTIIYAFNTAASEASSDGFALTAAGRQAYGMVSFIAFIAIFNLLLGYAIGSYLTASRGRVVRLVGDVDRLLPKETTKGESNPVSEKLHPPPADPSIDDPALPSREAPRTVDAPLDSESFADQLEEAVAAT